MKKILAILFASLAFAGIAYAATVPSEPAVYDSVLSAPLGSSDTTIFLKSATTNQGSTLSGFNCFTIDVNTPTVEYACGTVSGTNVTGLTRNIDYFTGTTTNANTSVQSHRTGADIRITDFPFAQIVRNIFSGTEVLPVNLHYNTGVTQGSGDSLALADVGYVNAISIAGAANAQTTVNGISQLATALQDASGTVTGSTGANLVIRSADATSSNDVAGLHVVVTQNSGKINWNLIDLGNNFTVTGLATFNTGGIIDNASSTFTSTANLNGTTSFGGTTTFNATSTFNAVVAGLRTTYASTTPTLTKNNGYATSSPFLTVPALSLTASSSIDIYGDWSCAQTNTAQSGCHMYISDNLGNKYLDMSVGFGQNNNQTLDCAFHAQILFNNSVSSQIILGQSSGSEQVNAAVTANSCPSNLVATLSLNYANAQQIGFVARGNDSNGTATLNNFSIIVNK